jgi:2-polyprenyl-3-methyl-5-hydroxy-6-metoxy-1,4-benzoquinol methylase
MDRLIGANELLDGPLEDHDELVTNLRDLARLNRLSGGAGLSRRAIAALGGAASVLDVGTGAGDIPVALLADARRRGVGLTVTATDSRPEVLAAARVVRPGLERVPGLDLGIGNGLALPWPAAAFDVGHASLVVHHLEPLDAIAFLTELRRVSRLGVVVNDLVRGRWTWLGTWIAVHAFARSRYTRHDGPLSVRRAYSRAELLDLCAAAGLAPVAVLSGFAGHRIAIAAR